MSLKVISPGMLTTFQDLGRVGQAHIGIPVSGVMDVAAARLANQMVANAADEAVLELTFTGITLQSSAACTLALCGAEFECFLNDEAVDQEQTIQLVSGDIFRMGRLKLGARAYLAVAGGYQLDKIMNSYSTLISAQLGGFHGRALKKCDRIELRNAHHSSQKRKYDWQKLNANGVFIVHAQPGPEYDWFSQSSQKLAFSQAFKLSPQSDRMGYRLQSESIKMLDTSIMISTGLMPGSLQITPDGQSILSMRDAQTTGGYPRMLVVNQQDLSVLAQAKPGDEIYFFRV